MSKGIIFYLLIGVFLIALVEKLMPEIQLAIAVVQHAVDYLLKRYGISFSAGAITVRFLANKNDTLAGSFGFVGNKMAFTIGKLSEFKAILLLTKAMKTLPI